ncbi:MAG: tRNA pseudouridine(38-40) synthase TruA [Marinilabiliales bacterium]|nr:MAG: tRNA pseudouridine(38-40) synthase TruA [Marinilabiliales bacterium]
MNRYILHLAYNGTNYHGWQRQPGSVTVQELVEQCLSHLVEKGITVVGAGRTDTGVHASEFYAHFETNHIFNSVEEARNLIFKMNRYLPFDIAIKNLYLAHPEFHARFSATAREYQYFIKRIKDPFSTEFALDIYGALDVKSMNRASGILLEYEDFSCFSRSNTQTKTNICNITRAEWRESESDLIFTIEANRFLRNMVRAVVGTLLDVGKGKLIPEDVHKIIQSKDRGNAGTSAAAKGLFLTKVEYPEGYIIPFTD